MVIQLCHCGRAKPCAAHPATSRPRSNPLKNTAAWRRTRAAALERDGHRCRRCGSPATAFDPLHVHHVVPRSEGGTDALSNLVTLCALCHPQVERERRIAEPAGHGRGTARKSARLPEERTPP
jgi:5-methylcytosine-specific restriction endonuclease McrA